ncbi:EAL domain-containing protein [Paenibacillus segetis]|nr:EAL domain-containing protein [Paenibacillus segetis]
MSLITYMNEQGYLRDNNISDCQYSYESRDEAMRILEYVNNYCLITGDELIGSLINGECHDRSPLWFPIPQMEFRLNRRRIINIIVNQGIESHMQPIVNTQKKVIGYEFLLRSSSSRNFFYPSDLFDIARETGLQSQLDQAARLTAIETSARHLPQGIKRFINFLPSSIENPNQCLNQTFVAMEQLSLDARDFVFEVVETERITHMAHLKEIFEVCRRKGISLALDDVGSGYSTLEEMDALRPDYIKIDRSLVGGCSQDQAKQEQIKLIIQRASAFGGKALAEGVEQMEDFQFCVDSGVVLAQGYLFGKPGKPY